MTLRGLLMGLFRWDLLRRHHRAGGVEHAVREAPLVVVPGSHLDEAAAGDLREGRVVGRAVRIMVEVAGDQGQ